MSIPMVFGLFAFAGVFLFFFGNLISLAGALILLTAVAMAFTPTVTRYLKSEL